MKIGFQRRFLGGGPTRFGEVAAIDRAVVDDGEQPVLPELLQDRARRKGLASSRWPETKTGNRVLARLSVRAVQPYARGVMTKAGVAQSGQGGFDGFAAQEPDHEGDLAATSFSAAARPAIGRTAVIDDLPTLRRPLRRCTRHHLAASRSDGPVSGATIPMRMGSAPPERRCRSAERCRGESPDAFNAPICDHRETRHVKAGRCERNSAFTSLQPRRSRITRSCCPVNPCHIYRQSAQSGMFAC